MTEVSLVRSDEGNLSKTLCEVREVFAQLGPSNRDIVEAARDLEIRIKGKIIDPKMYEQLNSYNTIALLGELCDQASSNKRYR